MARDGATSATAVTVQQPTNTMPTNHQAGAVSGKALERLDQVDAIAISAVRVSAGAHATASIRALRARLTERPKRATARLTSAHATSSTTTPKPMIVAVLRPPVAWFGTTVRIVPDDQIACTEPRATGADPLVVDQPGPVATTMSPARVAILPSTASIAGTTP